ncbi:MAG: SurA N-terminal domain-containing protein [Paracoccaceae bacterium]
MKSKINKFFAWIIVLLLVLGLVGFGLQDVLSRWGSSKLATVGDIEISTKEFGQGFISELSFISQNLGKNLSVEEAKSIGIHLRVLERLINRSLLDQMIKDLKISIGDTSLLKRIKANTNFQDSNGNFSRESYNLYLKQLNLTESEFEDILRNELSRELLTQVFNIKLDHNKFSTKTIADFVGEERKISFYKLKTNKETFNFEVKDIDVRNFYDNNSEKYRSKAIKKFTVLNLNTSTVLNELNIKEEDINKIYNERKKEFSSPEFRKLNRIVFPTQNLADIAYEEITNNKKTFVQIGQNMNLDENSLNFGTYSKEQLEKKLADLVFDKTNEKNTVIAPINGELGFELYEIIKIIPSSTLSENKAKNILKKEIELENSLNKLAEIIPEIEDKIASGETLEEISKNFFINIEQIEKINGEKLPKKYRNKNLESFFDNANYENSDLLQLEANSFISIRLDEEIEPSIPNYEEIYGLVLKDYKKTKEIKLLEENINELLTKYNLSEAVNLKKIDFLYDDVINRQSNDLKFLKKSTLNNIFQNTINDFVIEKIVNTTTPYIILIKTEEIIPANTKSNYKDILKNLQNQINDQFNNDIVLSLINDLRAQYKPKVNFELLEQIVDNIQ